MDKELDRLYEVLQKLVGLHRQLNDLVKAERTALEQLQTKDLQEITYNKEVVIHACKQAELERVRAMAALSSTWKLAVTEFSLLKFIEVLQGRDLKAADRFRNVYNTLKILVARISEQNTENRRLVEKSLEHVAAMKRNALGQVSEKSNTYTQKGIKSGVNTGSRLLFKEV